MSGQSIILNVMVLFLFAMMPDVIPFQPPVFSQQYPIYIIGAGGIVTDAHMPAYQLAGYTVAGIYDIDIAKATSVAKQFGIPFVFNDLQRLIEAAPETAIFDVAVPGSSIAAILEKLPVHAAVLMQKPMGDNLQQAKEILAIATERHLLAAVNFQLRYAPYVAQARTMITNGDIGELCGIDVLVDVYTPFHLWKFLYDLPRVEILYHSIHYVDLIRSFLGNPQSMLAKTTRHAAMPQLASVRSNIIMDYGEWISANILTNHCNNYGLQRQDAIIRIEGTKGIIRMRLGALMNYPAGVPPAFEYATHEQMAAGGSWQQLSVEGGWFPHAFVGSMAQLMQAKENGTVPNNAVQDCIYTMACVEAAYESCSSSGVPLTV